jgi:Domain of unknown function (DUF4345)
MRKNKNLQLLRVTLIFCALSCISYGFLHLFFPEAYVNASNGEPVSPGWIRFFGPILISIGVGAIMVYRSPEKQGIFVLVMAFGSLGAGLTQLYSVFYDAEGIGTLWDTISPMLVNFTLSILFFISLRRQKRFYGRLKTKHFL